MQIMKFADFAGVSVRTLHHYDEKGSLKPAHADKATGYRYCEETSILRMQEIFFYRELDFSLSIKEIISSPNYDITFIFYNGKKSEYNSGSDFSVSNNLTKGQKQMKKCTPPTNDR